MLCHLRVLSALHLFIVVEELGQERGIEATGLLVYKRCLHENGVCSFPQHVLQLFPRHRKAQLLGLRLEDGVVHIIVPNLVFQLVHLVFAEVVAPLCHLDYLLVFVYQALEILHREFLT